MNFVSYFIPTKAQEEMALRKLIKKYPLQFMIGNSLMDLKGHPMSYVGPYGDDPEGQLILHLTQKFFLSIAINRLLTTNTLTVENVMGSLIIPSPLFEESRYDIIRKAIELFIQGEYILFSHLLFPKSSTLYAIL